jgi:hypothetical protein
VVSSSSFARLELLVGRLQLVLRGLQLILQAPISRDIREVDLRPHDTAVGRDHRDHLDVEVPGFAVWRWKRDVAAEGGPALVLCLLDHAPEVRGPEGNLQVLEVTPDVVRSNPEHRPGPLVGVRQPPAGVDQHLGGGIDLEGDIAHACSVCHLFDRFRAGFRSLLEPPSSAMVRNLDEDPPLQVDGHEEIGVGEQHLRLAEKEEAVVVQRVVKAAQDASLCLVVEVHEGVPAHEEREPRDGGILDQIVPPEDDRAAELLVEDVVRTDPIEVALPEVGRHFVDVLGGVAALPRLAQRFLVHVRRVDLHAGPDGFHPELLGQQDRE